MLSGYVLVFVPGGVWVLIHCVSWNAFRVEIACILTQAEGLNPLCIVECFQGVWLAQQIQSAIGLNPLCIVECFQGESESMIQGFDYVLIHCVSWNAFRAVSFDFVDLDDCLNPLCIVECFQGLQHHR